MNQFDRAQQEALQEAVQQKKKPRDNAKKVSISFYCMPVVLEDWGLPPTATDTEILCAVMVDQNRLFKNAAVSIAVDGKISTNTRLDIQTEPSWVQDITTEQELLTEKEKYEQRQESQLGKSDGKDYRTHCTHGLERGECAG